MKEKEYKLAERKGITPYRVTVALDGIAVFLNEENPLDVLSIDQLKGIYTGAITNWKEIGGEDHVIILYGRENNSGTYSFFKEHVLKKQDYADQTFLSGEKPVDQLGAVVALPLQGVHARPGGRSQRRLRAGEEGREQQQHQDGADRNEYLDFHLRILVRLL